MFVTGSSRGLGRAIVEAGLLAGNKVLATARDIESLREPSERYGDQVKLSVRSEQRASDGHGVRGKRPLQDIAMCD
jgi:NADP-dependent 3-hydroxy acid dehydrogenase YdfG